MKSLQFLLSAEALSAAKEKALNLAAAGSSAFLFLDSCGYSDPYGEWEWLLLGAAGTSRVWTLDNLLAGDLPTGWAFGHLGYEAARRLWPSARLKRTAARWPPVLFREAISVVGQRRGEDAITVISPDPKWDWETIVRAAPAPVRTAPLPHVVFKPALGKAAYLKTVDALREHIAAGDCYEINLCNWREAGAVRLNALSAYRALRAASPAPFNALYRWGRTWAMCASPERYLRKYGRTLISQPIKGTAARGAAPTADAAARENLRNSPKERAENVMIVDLVRSDLARVCTPGSVAVDELFGVQTFPAVHQLVSTVRGELAADRTWWDAVRETFPMGSMTGAPKEMVMRLIERYEPAERGLFSGALGYVTPEGDFDFNVVIRSLFYEADRGKLSYSTGGAITWASNPEAEWEETVLKGAAIERLFKS